jgi:hypothetical protein
LLFTHPGKAVAKECAFGGAAAIGILRFPSSAKAAVFFCAFIARMCSASLRYNANLATPSSIMPSSDASVASLS